MDAFHQGTNRLEYRPPVARSPASETATLNTEMKMANLVPTNQVASPSASK